MNIRKMTIDDYDSVYSLWLNTPGMGLNNKDDSIDGIKRYLLRNPNTCFVAEINDEIVGVILSGYDGRRGLIYHLAVKVSERKRGVGTILVDQALNTLREEGIAKVYIIVYKDNYTGNEFWENRGFIVPENTLYRDKEIIPLEHTKV